MIKIIVAYDKNKLIGKDNDLPWQIKEELAHFKESTLNKKILLGKNTYESIPFLKERDTYVLTYDKESKYDNATIVNDYKKIVKHYSKNEKDDIYICGGVQIYKLFLPFVDELIISLIKKEYEGNMFFPDWDEKDFEMVKEKDFTEFKVCYYKRKKSI